MLTLNYLALLLFMCVGHFLEQWQDEKNTLLLHLTRAIYIHIIKSYIITLSLKKRCQRYDPLDFWDARKRASIVIKRAPFNSTRCEAIL